MTLKLNLKPLVGAALAAMIGYSGSASANIVDLFDDPGDPTLHTVTVVSGAPSPADVLANTTIAVGATSSMQYPGGIIPSPSIIGGYRDIIVTMNTKSGAGQANSNASAGGGGFVFNNTTGESGTASVQWDGDDSASVATLNPTGLGGLDLVNQTGCGSGCTYFQTLVAQADQGFTYQIGVYTDGANYAILTTVVPFQILIPTTATYEFEWFTRASGLYFDAVVPFTITRGGTGPDFNNIGALDFTLNADGATLAVDLAIGAVTKQVPEPGTLALMGLGLLGAAMSGRRRKQSAA